MVCRLDAPSHYLNQYWNIVNWTLGNKLQWNLNQNSNISIKKCIWKCCLWNGIHFVSASICQALPWQKSSGVFQCLSLNEWVITSTQIIPVNGSLNHGATLADDSHQESNDDDLQKHKCFQRDCLCVNMYLHLISISHNTCILTFTWNEGHNFPWYKVDIMADDAVWF